MTRIRWKTSPTDRRTQVGYKYRRQSVDFPKQVEKGTFVTRCIPLSDWYPRELVTAALQQQNREVIPRFGHSAPAVGVEIVAGCVVYVVRRSDPGTEPDKAQLTRELEYINRLSTTLTNSVSRMREPKEQPKGMAKVAVLPTELWTEVFSYLDTVTQTKLRPVCPTWNILLDSPYLRARIILDSSAFTKVDPNYEPVYFMIAALFKCFKYAHYIAVVDPRSWISEAGVWEMFDVINFIAQRQNGSKLKAVFLRGLCFCLLDSFYHDHPTLHRYLSGASCTLENPGMIYRGLPCDNVHIKRCRIVLSCLDYGSDIILSVKIRVRHQRLTGDFAGGLWSALEAGLPAPGHTELRRLGTWLSLHTHGKQTSHARKCVAFVCKTLCATQTADPRPTLHYRGKEWCVDGLKGLKLKKLSRVAQDFLIQLMDALSP
ncbi:uncharacterized protein LOC129602465 [Paramacrobiotus metropolitanus]|uniref:uncharacterized protein LOC129602465 n=1 Tax=Paramacrobiotus metropolitanus TaxID=2943436 RepID=UPI002445CF80|nr:uncharacterized protein LOC129602465 [Paramacrobiotus metropolitanus]